MRAALPHGCHTAATRSTPGVVSISQCITDHGGSREAGGSLAQQGGHWYDLPAGGAPSPVQSSVTAQSSDLLRKKHLEEKPLCLHSIRSPWRGGLPGGLEYGHRRNPHSSGTEEAPLVPIKGFISEIQELA